MSRQRRRAPVATLVGAVALLLATATSSMAATRFTVPPAASTYSASSLLGSNGNDDQASVALDANGTAHATWIGANGGTIESCTLGVGARSCAHLVPLKVANAQDSFTGQPQTLIPSPGVVDVLATECCVSTAVQMWTSTDDGKTFAPPVVIGNLSPLSDAVIDGAQIAMFSSNTAGALEQITALDGSTDATTSQRVDTDNGAVRAVALPSGELIIATEEDFSNSNSPDQLPDTDLVEESTPGATPDTFDGWTADALQDLVTGPSGTFVMTEVPPAEPDDPAPTVLQRLDLGKNRFTNQSYFPFPDGQDNQATRLFEDAAGRLHIVWVGYEERLWHSVSTNAGKTWTSHLLGKGPESGDIETAVGSNGTGVTLETSAPPYVDTTGPAQSSLAVLLQPLLITPTMKVSLTSSKVSLGHATTLVATISPAIPGHKVVLQQEPGKHWVTAATATEDRHGKVTFTRKPHKSGKLVYRIFIDGKAGSYDSATSSSLMLTVRTAGR